MDFTAEVFALCVFVAYLNIYEISLKYHQIKFYFYAFSSNIN